MKTSIVLGCGFGDEGKGNVTNWLSKSNSDSLVIRFNGGHQAGHTVVHNGIRHVFSSFGSGTLNGTPTFWSKFCTVYPPSFLKEYYILENLRIKPKIYVDPLTMITTPFDISKNRLDETLRGNENRHGSCGSGFGQTVLRHETLDHSYRIFVKDLKNEWILRQKLEQIGLYFGEYDPTTQSGIIDKFVSECDQYLELIDIVSWPLMDFGSFEHLIFEGAQGILLDREHGIFPYVTRSHTTSKNVWEMLGELDMVQMPTIYYLTRCYQTRHGNGPFFDGSQKLALVNNQNETNVTNEWQGEFKTGPFDLFLLEYSMESDRCYHKFDFKEKIVVTCMDQFIDSIPILRNNGDIELLSKDEFKNLFPKNTIFVSNPEM